MRAVKDVQPLQQMFGTALHRENVRFLVLPQSEEERRKDSSSSDAVVLLILLSFPVADSTSDLQVEDLSSNSVLPAAAAAAAAAAHLTLRLFFHGLKSVNSFASVFSQHLLFVFFRSLRRLDVT